MSLACGFEHTRNEGSKAVHNMMQEENKELESRKILLRSIDLRSEWEKQKSTWFQYSRICDISKYDVTIGTAITGGVDPVHITLSDLYCKLGIEA